MIMLCRAESDLVDFNETRRGNTTPRRTRTNDHTLYIRNRIIIIQRLHRSTRHIYPTKASPVDFDRFRSLLKLFRRFNLTGESVF